MHLRRALLLFAIVLGMAAVAAALTPPPDEREDESRDGAALREPSPPPGSEPPAGRRRTLRFPAGAPATTSREIFVGQHAVVEVAVREPGQVELAGLGLLQPARPGTPAVFDLLPAATGRHEVRFRPPGGTPRRAGVLVVRPEPSP